MTFPGIPAGVDVEKPIEIWRDGYLYFTGVSRFSEPIIGSQGKLASITGIDATNHLLSTRNITQSDVVQIEPKTLIQSATAIAGVGNGGQDTYGTAIWIRRDLDLAIDIISKMTGIIGWETLVHPNLNTLDFKQQVGVDKSSTVTFETGVNCTLAGWEKRSDSLWNRIYARGPSLTTGQILSLPSPGYVEDTASQALYGIRSKPTLEPDVPNQAGLITRANGYLAKHKDPVHVYNIDIVETEPGNLLAKYDIGDKVRLTASELDADANLRINRMDISYGRAGEKITLELASLALTFEDIAELYHCYSVSAHGTDASVGGALSGTRNASAQTGVHNVSGGEHWHYISGGQTSWEQGHAHYWGDDYTYLEAAHSHAITDPSHNTNLVDHTHFNVFTDPKHLHGQLKIDVRDRRRGGV